MILPREGPAMYYRMLKLIKTTSIKVGSRGVLVTPGALEHARLGVTRDFGMLAGGSRSNPYYLTVPAHNFNLSVSQECTERRAKKT